MLTSLENNILAVVLMLFRSFKEKLWFSDILVLPVLSFIESHGAVLQTRAAQCILTFHAAFTVQPGCIYGNTLLKLIWPLRWKQALYKIENIVRNVWEYAFFFFVQCIFGHHVCSVTLQKFKAAVKKNVILNITTRWQ